MKLEDLVKSNIFFTYNAKLNSRFAYNKTGSTDSSTSMITILAKFKF